MGLGASRSQLLRAEIEEAGLAKKQEFDAMGQPVGTPIGNPDRAAIEAIEAQRQGQESQLTPLVDVPSPSRKRERKKKGLDPAAKDAVLEALRDPEVMAEAMTPEIVRAMIKTASKDPTLRKTLNLPAGAVPPSGDYRRNYGAEPALKVFGGVEVEHDPGFEPLPPSYLTKFVAKDADVGKTDDQALAAVGEDGRPIKTEEYKHFLDVRRDGGHLDGKVRYDIAADNFTPGDVGIEV